MNDATAEQVAVRERNLHVRRTAAFSRLSLWSLASYAALGITFVLVAGATLETKAQQQPQSAALLQEAFTKAIAQGERSVVAIARVGKQTPDALPPLPFGLQRGGSLPTDPEYIPDEFGAGVVIDESGLIVTALHVLGDLDTSEHYVWTQRRPFKAEVVATSPWFDLAVLRIEAQDLVAMQLGDGAALKKGDIVVALGNPYAIARDGRVSADWGIVANLQRQAPRVPSRSSDAQGRETLHHFGTLIQTNTKLADGFSGGALLNLEGKMVGLTTSFAAAPRFERPAGLAIPVDDTFKRLLDALKRGETPGFGFLGVEPGTLSTTLRQQGHHGARVDSVVVGTPAAKADLRPDDVITHVGGVSIFGESDLFREVGKAAPGTRLGLRLVRGGFTADHVVLEKEVVLSKKHVNTKRQPVVTRDPPAWRGMVVDYATASDSFGRQSPRPPADSLYVLAVVADSQASVAGFREGDFITHVGDLQVTTPAEFTATVADASGDVTIHAISADGTAVPRTVSP